MSHKKTWHHVRLLCVLTHDLKGWQDSQDKRGGDVTCSGYDEDDDDEEDWSQDYDKRSGDVTCGQGGEIIRVGIALEFRQSFCSQVLYTLRQWTTTTTIEIRQSFCSQAFPPLASAYNDIHRGALMVEKHSSSKPTNAREKLQKKVSAKVQKGVQDIFFALKFRPNGRWLFNFLSLYRHSESALNLPLSVQCALAMTVRGQFGPLWLHCGSHCTYCDCIVVHTLHFAHIVIAQCTCCDIFVVHPSVNIAYFILYDDRIRCTYCGSASCRRASDIWRIVSVMPPGPSGPHAKPRRFEV